MSLTVENLTELITSSVREILNKAYIIPVGELKKAINKPTAQNSSQISNASTLQLLNKKVIVEEDVKIALKKNITSIEIMKNAIITPSAKDMALHKKIKFVKK